MEGPPAGPFGSAAAGPQDSVAYAACCTSSVQSDKTPGASPLVHIQALRAAVQQEWLKFQQNMEKAAAEHLKLQEQLFTRCLEQVSEGADSREVVVDVLTDTATSVSVDAHATAKTNSAQVRQLAVTRARCANAAATDPNVLVSLPVQAQAQRSPRGVDMAGMVQSALMPMKASVHRMESILMQLQGTSSLAEVSMLMSSENKLRKGSSGHSLGSLGSDQTGSGATGSGQPSVTSGPGRTKSAYADMLASSKAFNQHSMFPMVQERLSSFLDWWTELQEPKRSGWLARLVQSKAFEVFSVSVICVNASFSCVALNEELRTSGADPSDVIVTSEYLFISFYTIELVMKLIVHRAYFFCNDSMSWNIFDAVLVLFSLLDMILSATVLDSSETDVTFMRTLRILRIARVLRGLRVMRFFSELRLMLRSLIGSLSSLFWSIAMLGLIFYIYALVFVQGVATYFITENVDRAEKVELLGMFGSVQEAVLTLFMACTGGNDWANFFVELKPVGLGYCFLFIFFIAFSHIALMNILTAIFVERAMKLAEPDRETLAMEQRRDQIAEYEELRDILNEIDVDNTGTINISEFSANIKTGKLGARMSVLGLDIRDAPLFYELVTVGFEGDEISIEEFVDRCMALKGNASCIDVQHLGYHVQQIEKAQQDLQLFTSASLRELGKSAGLRIHEAHV